MPRPGWRRWSGQGLDAGLPVRDEAEQGEPRSHEGLRDGQHIKTATLTARKAGKGQQDYLTFKFHDVLVSSFQTGGSENADVVPTDQVSFNFAKLEVEYKPQKLDGSFGPAVHFKYDLKANKTF